MPSKDLQFKLSENAIEVRSFTDPEKVYYVSPRICPHCDGLILICTCPDFTMGRPHRGINPFADPCTHVMAVRDWVKKERGSFEAKLRNV